MWENVDYAINTRENLDKKCFVVYDKGGVLCVL